MTRDITDVNKYSEILYVVFDYTIIKYLYANVKFPSFLSVLFLCIVILLISSCISNLKVTLCPHISNGVKYCFKFYNLLFANGRREYYIQLLFCQKNYFFIVGVKCPRTYNNDIMVQINQHVH